MQIFLGSMNFYHQFIDHYFKITASLTGLLKGSVKSKKTESFEFPLAAEEAFNELQKAFCSAPILKHFNPALSIWLEINVSDFAFAGILSQPFRNMSGDGISWYSVAFWSQKMINVKTHYKIYDDELLIIVIFFKYWCHYLDGSQHPIKVFINHNNLWYFMSKVRLNDCQSWWFMMFTLYNFVIAHWFSIYNSTDEPFC